MARVYKYNVCCLEKQVIVTNWHHLWFPADLAQYVLGASVCVFGPALIILCVYWLDQIFPGDRFPQPCLCWPDYCSTQTKTCWPMLAGLSPTSLTDPTIKSSLSLTLGCVVVS